MSQLESAAGTAQAEYERPWFKHYQPDVPHSIDYPEVPLHALLENSASRYASNRALAFFGHIINYRDLNAAADRFAAGLVRLGLRKGDRVALVLPNCPQFVIAFYGTLKAGGVV